MGFKREPRCELSGILSERTKGLFEEINSAGGKKKWWRHHQISREIEEGDIVTSMISNKKPQKRVSSNQVGLQRTHKRASQDIRAENQVLLTMVLGKNWPVGPFLTSYSAGTLMVLAS